MDQAASYQSARTPASSLSAQPQNKTPFPFCFPTFSISLFFSSLQSALLELLHLVPRPQKMPEAVAKSPKTPRRLKTGGEPLRQVHWQSPGSNADTKPAISSSSSSSAPFSSSTTASSTTNGESINVNTATLAPDNQPSSFPQLGAAPNSSLASDQWHTSIDPTQSVKLPGQPFAGGFAAPGFAAPGFAPGFTCAPPQTHFGPFSALPQASAAPFTYVGFPPQHQHLPPQHHFAAASMADYQNAAPMPHGVNFQPPVPDTTFGPIPHVYVPRFDGGFMPAAVQVGLPSVQFVSAPAACSTTVVMPKTFYYYNNGFTYYASRPAARILPLDVALFSVYSALVQSPKKLLACLDTVARLFASHLESLYGLDLGFRPTFRSVVDSFTIATCYYIKSTANIFYRI
jgi:hypothetical protein